MPASGKTSCAKLLSKELDALFCDSDELIESAARSSISDLFESKGESYFRALESLFVRSLSKIKDKDFVQSITNSDNDNTEKLLTTEVEKILPTLLKARKTTLIVSTGGGLPIDSRNLATLKTIGFVVYLYTQPHILANRMMDDNSRPLLTLDAITSPESNPMEPIKKKVNRLDRITSLLSERDFQYKMAHCTIDTSFQSQTEVVNSVIHKFNNWKSNEDF